MLPLRLPKDVAADPRHETICALLATNTTPLWEGANLRVATFPLNDEMTRECRRSIAAGLAIPGLEAIGDVLASEQKGLDALIAKAPDAPQNPRVSRLLLMSNDGSKRFYRDCESLLAQYAQRVIGCRLDVTGDNFGAVVFGYPKLVRAVLFVDKKAVARALLTLAPQ
jgi:hypothetical protein